MIEWGTTLKLATFAIFDYFMTRFSWLKKALNMATFLLR